MNKKKNFVKIFLNKNYQFGLVLGMIFTVFFITKPVYSSTNLIGEEGFINTPSAHIINDRSLKLGLTYLPGARSYVFTGKPNLIYSMFLGFIPRTEIGIAFNQVFGWVTPDNPYLKNESSFDRSVYVKFQVLEEAEFIPALAIGGRDIISSSNVNDYKGPTSSLQQVFYITLGKTFKDFNFNLGYSYAPEIPFGYDKTTFNKDKVDQGFRVNGFFAAIETPKAFSLVSGILEYDSKYFNYGVNLGPYYGIQAKLAMVDLVNFNFRINWLVNL